MSTLEDNNIGPGLIPCTINPPIKTAVTVSQGIPRDSKGISAPPRDALLDDSLAYIPAGLPLPNESGFLELCFVCAYAIKFAPPLPNPGKIPTKVPIAEDLIIFQVFENTSLKLIPNPFNLPIFCWVSSSFNIPSRISVIEKKPSITTIKLHPLFRNSNPNVNLVVPSIGA